MVQFKLALAYSTWRKSYRKETVGKITLEMERLSREICGRSRRRYELDSGIKKEKLEVKLYSEMVLMTDLLKKKKILFQYLLKYRCRIYTAIENS